MNRLALVPLAVACALLLSAPAAQSQGPPPFTDEWRDMGLRIAEQYGLFGAFAFDRGELRGAFVEARVEETTGTIRNLTVAKPFGTVEVFRSITMAPTAVGVAAVDGPAFSFRSLYVAISMHNNPAVGLVHRALTADLTVAYELAAGASFVLEGQSAYVSGGGLRGRIALLGTGMIIAVGSTVTVSLQADASVGFRVMLVDGEGPTGSWDQAAVQEAFARGVVAAESFLISLEGAILSDDAVYLDVSVSASQLRTGAVQITISSDLPSGRSLVIYLSQEALAGRHRDPLIVEFDGARIPETSSADEALVAGPARFHATASDQGVVFAAFLPSFSTHTLLIQVPELLPLFPRDMLGLATVAIAIAVVSAATVLALRPSRRKR